MVSCPPSRYPRAVTTTRTRGYYRAREARKFSRVYITTMSTRQQHEKISRVLDKRHQRLRVAQE